MFRFFNRDFDFREAVSRIWSTVKSYVADRQAKAEEEAVAEETVIEAEETPEIIEPIAEAEAAPSVEQVEEEAVSLDAVTVNEAPVLVEEEPELEFVETNPNVIGNEEALAETGEAVVVNFFDPAPEPAEAADQSVEQVTEEIVLDAAGFVDPYAYALM